MAAREDDGFREGLNPSHQPAQTKASNIIRYVMLPGMKHRMSTRSGPPNGLM
jgi:hypothetical protein